MNSIYLKLPSPEVGGIFLDGLVSESRSQDVNVSNNPINRGALITDIAHAENDTIQISGLVSGISDINLGIIGLNVGLPSIAKLTLVEEALFNVQNTFGLFTVITHKNVYIKYMITSLKTSVNYPDLIMQVDITARKIKIVKLTKNDLRQDKSLKTAKREPGYNEVKDSRNKQNANKGMDKGLEAIRKKRGMVSQTQFNPN